MTDVTLIVMAADNPVADTPGRWRRGEVVNVYPYTGEPPLHPRHLAIHITGIPASIERIRARLTVQHVDDDGETSIARRRFVGRGDLMPASARQRLNEERHITVTWDQAKSFARRRRARVLDAEDEVKDSDLDG